jgi:hypothetical protein
MTIARLQLRLREPSPALARIQPVDADARERSVRRRIGWIWGLLFLNVLPYFTKSTLVPMPTSVGKIVTQSALVVALLLALSVNPKVFVRPNWFLILMSVLCITSVMMSVRGYFGLGSVIRAGRLCGFVAVLWLLTPWWGRRDLLLLRFHRRALAVVLGVVVLGLVLMPGRAMAQGGGGRLGGVIWPIPPTQVAHYAAVLAGTTIVLWFAGLVSARAAAAVSSACVVILVLTHTRTALIGLLVGVLVGGLSLFLSRRRVRKALAVAAIVGGLVAVSFAPFLSAWFTRGESSHELAAFTGRTNVWTELVAQPRTEVNTVFGFGMSNDSFNGLPVDSSWYSTYLDQGLFGDAVDGAVLLLLLVIALFSPKGPRRAVALFLVVYCLIASVTETGLGEASPYLLDLAVAMAVLAVPPTAAVGELPAA